MLAHQFSVSKPPSKPIRTVGKRQVLRDTIEAATQFVFTNITEWCLVGTFPAKTYGSRKHAYARMKYYQERLEAHIAMVLNYHADLYPITWDISWNKAKAQYEVRIHAEYRPAVGYNETEESPYVDAVQYAEFDKQVKRQMAEHKQVNALKSAMDSLFFSDGQQ